LGAINLGDEKPIPQAENLLIDLRMMKPERASDSDPSL
jgi:hypothetical protein